MHTRQNYPSTKCTSRKPHTHPQYCSFLRLRNKGYPLGCMSRISPNKYTLILLVVSLFTCLSWVYPKLRSERLHTKTFIAHILLHCSLSAQIPIQPMLHDSILFLWNVVIFSPVNPLNLHWQLNGNSLRCVQTTGGLRRIAFPQSPDKNRHTLNSAH